MDSGDVIPLSSMYSKSLSLASAQWDAFKGAEKMAGIIARLLSVIFERCWRWRGSLLLKVSKTYIHLEKKHPTGAAFRHTKDKVTGNIQYKFTSKGKL